MQAVVEIVHQIRSKFNWSQQKLADHLEVSQRAVSLWERGEAEPSKRMRKVLEGLLKSESNSNNDNKISGAPVNHETELLLRCERAEAEARVYKYVCDRLLDKAVVSLATADIQGLRARLDKVDTGTVHSSSSIP